MNRNKKVLLAVFASSFLSNAVMASEIPDFMGEPDSKKEEKTIKLSKSNADKSDKSDKSDKEDSYLSKIKKAEVFIDPYISASRSAETSKKLHELEMLKINMESAELEKALAEMASERNKVNVDEMVKERKDQWDKEKSEIIADYESRISSLQEQIKNLSKKSKEQDEAKDFLKEKLFITKVFGFGHNKHAEFYYDNNISRLSVGDEIIPGAKVVEILKNGAKVSYKGETSLITTTTRALAESKTLSKDELEYQKSLEEAKYGITRTPSDIGSVPPIPR